ncbi:MAG TPA: polysaccharide deacetylase family protein [Sediminibacterium sp.]|nr:polysaccharide deacetylase family protein [Sediminibacterium sp.]
MPEAPVILLSFDVEEFDLPLEYGQLLAEEQQMAVGKAGLDAIRPILADPQVQTTLFTTAHFASQYPGTIQQLAERHEIASHTFFHNRFEEAHLLASRQVLEQISQQPVSGLRMPRMQPVSIRAVAAAGYQYDASIHPTWIPGRYNNRHLPRTIYREETTWRLPASVSPGLRIPLFWLSFKNFPFPLYQRIALQTLRRDGYLCLYFHPWEFVDIRHFGLPRYVAGPGPDILLSRMFRFLGELKKQAVFERSDRFIQKKEPRLG